MAETAIEKLCREARESVDTVVAERDQLRQQVEKLISAVDTHEGEWDESYGLKGPDRKTEPLLAAVWDDDQVLYAAADQVRKELGE
jgi:hypothetical protein